MLAVIMNGRVIRQTAHRLRSCGRRGRKSSFGALEQGVPGKCGDRHEISRLPFAELKRLGKHADSLTVAVR